MTSLSQAEMGKPSQRKPALSSTTMESARRFLYDEDEPSPQNANVALPPAPRAKLSDNNNKRLNPIVAACMATLNTLKTYGGKRSLLILAVVVGVVLVSMGIHSLASAGSHKNDKARLATIQSKIVEAGVSSQADMQKAGTAQYHALDWLSNHDKAELDAEDPQLAERYAMAVFFFSLGADNDHVNPDSGWKTHSGWMTEAGYCDWYGVSCLSDTAKSVESISLESNDLQGTLPTELAGLPNLMVLNLGKNSNVGGTLPTELALMSNLRFLVLRDNSMDGTIPSEFGQFSSLRQLDLGGNNLKGEIPKELENSFTLKALALNDNNFEGTVPEFIQMESLGKSSECNSNSAVPMCKEPCYLPHGDSYHHF